jgi:hypothetical protein
MRKQKCHIALLPPKKDKFNSMPPFSPDSFIDKPQSIHLNELYGKNVTFISTEIK